MPRLTRTINFRLALLYCAMFMLSVAILCATVYWIARQALEEQLRASVQREMTVLESLAPEPTLHGLAAAIDDRLRRTGAAGFRYRLQDRTGALLAGDLGMPLSTPGWHRLVLTDATATLDVAAGTQEEERGLLVLGRSLDNGHVLSVAVDTWSVNEAEEAILRAFGGAAVISALLALLGGVLLSRGFLRRVDAITRTTRSIVAGDLAERIPIKGTGDEMDRLGLTLNEMLDRLQASMEGLKQVSNDIAHDLRTPLSRLRQVLETARLEAGSRQALEEAVDLALVEANSALATFGALLRIAQIESGTRRSHFAVVDLSSLARDLALTYGAVAEDMDKRLSYEIAVEVEVEADRELLTQALVNLIENALRHTPAGAEIEVSVARVDDVACVRVRDDGPGIPEQERGRVLERFYRLEGSRTTPGSGLGLALVAAVAALHGARVELADNHPGLCATLCMEALPRS
ncbi:MAG: HAMP domain-containing protein [Gammaproteobacteria bacterium]|nr:HAMP domain-containing protein [Gammaproteobacteria bacterium]